MKIFLSIVFLFFCFNLTFGCSCIKDKTADGYVRDAGAILVGKIISIEEQSDSRDDEGNLIIPPLSDAKVKVIKAWKGVAESEIIIEINELSTCNDLKEGDTVLFFAYGNKLRDGGRCPRLYTTEQDVIKKLGEGKSFSMTQERLEISESIWSRLWQKITSFFS
jgi:hypothetical protein